MWRSYQFCCTQCSHEYEDLLWKAASDEAFKPELTCPECGKVNKPCIGLTGVGSFSAMSREGQIESMKKRSADHSRAHIAKNKDEFRAKMRGRK